MRLSRTQIHPGNQSRNKKIAYLPERHVAFAKIGIRGTFSLNSCEHYSSDFLFTQTPFLRSKS
jgi:hypothetical protein